MGARGTPNAKAGAESGSEVESGSEAEELTDHTAPTCGGFLGSPYANDNSISESSRPYDSALHEPIPMIGAIHLNCRPGWSRPQTPHRARRLGTRPRPGLDICRPAYGCNEIVISMRLSFLDRECGVR